jgi:hypothetical protein
MSFTKACSDYEAFKALFYLHSIDDFDKQDVLSFKLAYQQRQQTASYKCDTKHISGFQENLRRWGRNILLKKLAFTLE